MWSGPGGTDTHTRACTPTRRDSGHTIFHVHDWGAVCAPRAPEREERGAAAILKVTPLIQAATVQLSGTMTEDDGFCCRGGIRQTERRKKGLSTFGFKRERILHGYFCVCFFLSFSLLTWFLLQWKNRWLVLRKPSPVAGTIPPTLSELLKYDVN